VHGGSNTLRFSVERLGHVRLARVRILGDSGLQVSSHAAPRLALDVSLPHSAVAGKTFTIGVTLTNRGGLPARRGGASVETSSDRLEVVGAANRRFSALAPGARWRARFRLRPQSAGEYRLDVTAGAENANHPLAEIAVSVAPPHATAAEQEGSGPSSAGVAAGGLFASGLLAAAAARARRRRPDE
jgi:hypothetical protein